MSSKRGRKRNDNLPPNRARDVQRAFRARRAAHLQALEQRVSELEEENSCLRQALNLPQANRPPLGKGPTGKDKPKDYESPQPIHQHSLLLPPSRDDSSSADSPASESDPESPTLVSHPIPSRAEDIVNGTGPWQQTIVMTEDIPHYQPVSAPPTMSAKSMPYSPSPYHISRSSSLTPMYMYTHSERTTPTYAAHFEQQQQQPPQHSYSYSSGTPQSQPQQAQAGYDMGNGRDVHVAPGGAMVGYPPQRRPTVEYTITGHFPHLPTPSQASPIRVPSPPRALQDHPHLHHDMHGHGHHSQHDPHAHHRPAYSSDGRILT